jgi:hypothetical protein
MTAKKEDPCPNASTALASRQLSEEERIAKIRDLNDHLRRTGRGGKVIITQGVISKGLDFAKRALADVSEFNAFTPDNDPWGEHDCAVVQVLGTDLIFKIDYYDLSLTQLSERPHDPDCTRRIFTLVLACEY